MTGTERECPVCGVRFEAQGRRKYCSETCRIVEMRKRDVLRYHSSEYCQKRRKKRAAKSKNAMSIAAVNALARKAGLTYGQYMFEQSSSEKIAAV